MQHGPTTASSKQAFEAACCWPPVPTFERKPPVRYGKPFILLEDTQKSTFIFNGGQWVRHTKSIAECRLDCQVKELAQKINDMTRYEVCAPLSAVT
jgi:hypothetical protein